MTDTLNIEETLAFSASVPRNDDLDFSAFADRVGDGFNDYGVRENYDEDGTLESVDVLYEAMQPGPPENRNGVRITQDFLRAVASKEYNDPPHLRDHEDKNTFARIGRMKDAFFSDATESMWVMTRTPNIEGSQAYQEAIARYTHEPPEITDGSVGFGNQYEAVRNDDGEPELVDGKIREFSTVNFPGGYDDGGVRAAFAEAVEEVMTEFDDPAADTRNSGEDSATDDVNGEFTIETETIQF